MLADFAVAVGYLTHIMSHFVAVSQPGGGTLVACGHDAFVFNDDCAACSSVAGCACSYGFAHVKEVSVPVGSLFFVVNCHFVAFGLEK